MATYPVNIRVDIENESTLGQTKIVDKNGVTVSVSEEVNLERFESNFLETVLDLR